MGRTVTLTAGGGRRTTLSWYEPGERHRAHRHAEAQVSCLLAGAYDEDSPHGARRVTGAAVSLKPGGFEHENGFGEDGVLMLSSSFREAPFVSRYAVGVRPDARDWPVQGEAALTGLCARLDDHPAAPIAAPPWLDAARRSIAFGARTSEVARAYGLHPVRLAQLFRAGFSEAPSAVRQGRRLARSIAGLVASTTPLADLAAEAGFADQAHMSRAIKAATGFAPGALRRLFAAV